LVQAEVFHRQLALAAGRATARQVTLRRGHPTHRHPTARPQCARRFWRSASAPTNRDIPRAVDGSLPECWLTAVWSPGEPEPVKYWLSNMDKRTTLKTLVRLAKIRWRVEHDREPKTGLGIDHFQGRSFTGWHRHVTLAVLALAFCTLLRLDPKADAPA
jgi:SRSO17 transposase